MIVREMVIKGLEVCFDSSKECNGCPYITTPYCRTTLRNDVIAMLKEQETMVQCIKGKCRICPHCTNCDVDENGLLKEQEAVEPIPFFIETGAESQNYVICGHCKSIKAIMPKYTKQKYCHECGSPVLWEGR